MVLQNGEYYIIGFKNNNLLFSKYGTDRKKKSEKQYPLQEKIISVDQIILSDAGKGILLLHLNKEDVILFFNTLDGTVTKTLNFSPGRIKDLAIDNNKNLLLLLEDVNSVLIKYSGTDF